MPRMSSRNLKNAESSERMMDLLKREALGVLTSPLSAEPTSAFPDVSYVLPLQPPPTPQTPTPTPYSQYSLRRQEQFNSNENGAVAPSPPTTPNTMATPTSYFAAAVAAVRQNTLNGTITPGGTTTNNNNTNAGPSSASSFVPTRPEDLMFLPSPGPNGPTSMGPLSPSISTPPNQYSLQRSASSSSSTSSSQYEYQPPQSQQQQQQQPMPTNAVTLQRQHQQQQQQNLEDAVISPGSSTGPILVPPRRSSMHPIRIDPEDLVALQSIQGSTTMPRVPQLPTMKSSSSLSAAFASAGSASGTTTKSATSAKPAMIITGSAPVGVGKSGPKTAPMIFTGSNNSNNSNNKSTTSTTTSTTTTTTTTMGSITSPRSASFSSSVVPNLDYSIISDAVDAAVAAATAVDTNNSTTPTPTSTSTSTPNEPSKPDSGIKNEGTRGVDKDSRYKQQQRAYKKWLAEHQLKVQLLQQGVHPSMVATAVAALVAERVEDSEREKERVERERVERERIERERLEREEGEREEREKEKVGRSESIGDDKVPGSPNSPLGVGSNSSGSGIVEVDQDRLSTSTGLQSTVPSMTRSSALSSNVGLNSKNGGGDGAYVSGNSTSGGGGSKNGSIKERVSRPSSPTGSFASRLTYDVSDEESLVFTEQVMGGGAGGSSSAPTAGATGMGQRSYTLSHKDLASYVQSRLERAAAAVAWSSGAASGPLIQNSVTSPISPTFKYGLTSPTTTTTTPAKANSSVVRDRSKSAPMAAIALTSEDIAGGVSSSSTSLPPMPVSTLPSLPGQQPLLSPTTMGTKLKANNNNSNRYFEDNTLGAPGTWGFSIDSLALPIPASAATALASYRRHVIPSSSSSATPTPTTPSTPPSNLPPPPIGYHEDLNDTSFIPALPSEAKLAWGRVLGLVESPGSALSRSRSQGGLRVKISQHFQESNGGNHVVVPPMPTSPSIAKQRSNSHGTDSNPSSPTMLSSSYTLSGNTEVTPMLFTPRDWRDLERYIATPHPSRTPLEARLHWSILERTLSVAGKPPSQSATTTAQSQSQSPWCPRCGPGTIETLLHFVWECPVARGLWSRLEPVVMIDAVLAFPGLRKILKNSGNVGGGGKNGGNVLANLISLHSIAIAAIHGARVYPLSDSDLVGWWLFRSRFEARVGVEDESEGGDFVEEGWKGIVNGGGNGGGKVNNVVGNGLMGSGLRSLKKDVDVGAGKMGESQLEMAAWEVLMKK
ncbi:hypothetical protein HDU76_012686 [Blyttiomyces sp. JEL0837]|nr:hypothetical protein HDU76_012686 [Blyttiomyces sp. JEL0837]